MKTLSVLLVSLTLVLTATAQTDPRAKTAPEPVPAGKEKADKAGAQKKAPPPKIEGMEIPRGSGFMGLEIVDGNFKLTFYDAKKKPVPPDVTSAAFRWDTKSKSGPERALLTPGGGPNSLSSPKTIRPPYIFRLYITLLKDSAGGEAAGGESFGIDFRQ